MLKTILLGIYLIVPVLLFSILVFPYLLIVWLKLGKWADPYVKSLGAAYSRHLLWLGGGRVTVRGLENIPARKDICFISNHQSYVDIPLIVGYIPRLTGFVAKSELFKVPFLRIWLKALGCVKLNRGSGRSAIAMISEGSKSIRDGHPLVMFPEGTRMKNKSMDQIQIKSGTSFIAYKFKLPILPIHINWPDKLSKTVLKRLPVRIKIKPPIIPDKEHIRDYFPERQIMDLPDKEVINLLTPFILKKIQYPET